MSDEVDAASLLHDVSDSCIAISFAVAPDESQAELNRLRAEIEKLKERLESMKAVNGAKEILMGRQRLSADDAMTLIQRQAMERRVEMRVVANEIIYNAQDGEEWDR